MTDPALPPRSHAAACDATRRSAPRSPTSAAGTCRSATRSDLAEHHAVRTAAGIFDISHMAEFLVDGPRGRRLPRLRPRRAALRDAVWQAKYSAAARPLDGGIIDDLVVYRTRRRPLPRRRQRGQPRCRSRAALAEPRRPASTASVDRRERRLRAHRRAGPDARAILEATRRHRPTSARPPRRAAVLRARPTRLRGRAAAGRPHRLHRRGRLRAVHRRRTPPRRSGTRCSPPARRSASCPPGSPPATPCASRRACRSTATSSSLDTFPAQAGLGRVVAADKKRLRRARRRSTPASAPTRRCWSASSRRAGAPAAPATRCSDGDDARRRDHERRAQPDPRHPIAMAFVAPAVGAPTAPH